MGTKELKEVNSMKSDIYKNILISMLVLVLIGIVMMLIDYFVYGKSFWNSTTCKLIFAGLFVYYLYRFY